MKRILNYFAVLLLLVASWACSSSNETPVTVNPEFGKYISTFTSGLVSNAANIKLVLNAEIAKMIDKNSELDEDLLQFEPSLSGKLNWVDAVTLEFIPDKPMISNKLYKANFNLGEIANVPNSFKEFEFNFHTIKQSFELNIDQIKTVDKKTLKKQSILGTIRTADAASLEVVKKMFSAEQNGDELQVNWTPSSDNTIFSFEIQEVTRTNSASSVEIACNGEAIDVDKVVEEKLEIPSLNDFKFISAKVVQQPQQHVVLQFSDPIKSNLQLAGLITVKGLRNLNFIIEDNLIKVYPASRLSGTYEMKIHEGIYNVLNIKMKQTENLGVVFEKIKPAVRQVGKGVILPNSPKGLLMPFEAVNLKAVDVQVIKIFENNITQFLQVNDLNGSYQLKRVGKPVLRKTIQLNQANVVDFGKWNKFYLDLNDLIKPEPGAIYRIVIGFRQQHSLYDCAGESDLEDTDLQTVGTEWEPEDGEASFWDMYNEDYYDDYYYYDDNYWENRKNPCKKAYYGKRHAISRNILASDLGLIAKKSNNGSLHVFVNNILDTKLVSGVLVEVYDYQNQLIASKKTDSQGRVQFEKIDEAYFLVAKQAKQRAYLKLTDGSSLSLSRFDVSGKAVKKGVKGFLYGERGVWRPGDTLFISFILDETNARLPSKHPVVFELKNPKSQLVKRIVKKKNDNGFYTFIVKTEADAPTGNWNAKVSIGGVDFYKNLKIETIKPNRLKIKFNFEKEYLVRKQAVETEMEVAWLHGAVAKNLKANVQVNLTPVKTTFKKYDDYSFDDPSKRFYGVSNEIFKGKTDENGKLNFTVDLEAGKTASGKLKATFVSKVFEQGGNFSIDQFSIPYYPFESFVGIRLPKGDKSRGMLLTDKAHSVDIVILNGEGKLVQQSHTLDVELYKLKWRWWWDKSSNDISNYISRSHVQAIQKKTISSNSGKANWKIQINYPEWGRYFVRVSDRITGHSSGRIVYIDWPGWAGRSQKDNPGGASMLTFTSDKSTYEVGEEVELTIPSGEGGRALVSIENGSKVIKNYWLETEKGETTFSFDATADMSPNAYVNITLLQPHAQTANDLPIRMYGIIPIQVENPETHLEPEISMPDELESEKEFTVKVSESNSKSMTYTIAVVDDGLLDLTRFKTPDPWNSFNAREALGVKTWDIYDAVIGAYGGKLERLLSLGGDGEEGGKKGKKANRFKPVVKFLGPFALAKGKTNTHKIKMPRYIGSVRTMVIAASGKASGSTDKTCRVTKPLMVLGSLPRVLGPQETVKLPVNLFVMDKSIKNATVQVKTNGLLQVLGSKSKEVNFNGDTEGFVEFDLQVKKKLGIATVEILVQSGSNKATYEIELDVRNPNPRVTDVMAKVLSNNEVWNNNFTPIGMNGTNHAVLELSSVPPLNLGERLKYLISYPHGCVEQTTSSAFPQLYLEQLTELDSGKKKRLTQNVKAAITRLMSFQLFNGGLSYWAGNKNISEWGTNYAGHFLLEAKRKGYTVSSSFLKKWRKYQSKKARNWVDDGNNSQLLQAYRLYTLALEGHSEKGAMNRLKEKSNLSVAAKWRLAAAYFLSGKEKTARKMVESLSTEISPYTELSYTYGSDTRDKAMILETLTLLGRKKQAFGILKSISERLSSRRWYSTQSLAYSLIAISQYLEKNGGTGTLKYTYTWAGKSHNQSSTKAVSSVEIPLSGAGEQNLTVKNTGGGMLYARLIVDGIPLVGEASDASNSLNMSIVYKLMDGTAIQPEQIAQGTDFVAELTIKNPGLRGNYKEMALTQIFPSGWEIINSRLINATALSNTSVPTYQDIRDDRVYTYFDISRNRNKTYRVLLNAAFVGRYYLPTIYCEAMYDATINARQHGTWVEVIKE